MAISVLKRIIHEMDLVADLPMALNLVVQHLGSELPIEASCIFLLDEEKIEYVLLAATGVSSNLVGRLRIKLGEGLIGQVGEREEPINLVDSSAYADILDLNEEFRGFFGVPILYQGHLFGVLTAHQRAAQLFDTEVTTQIGTLAVQLAEDIAAGCAKGGLQAVLKPKGRKIKEFSGLPGAPGVAIGKGVIFFPAADLNSVRAHYHRG